MRHISRLQQQSLTPGKAVVSFVSMVRPSTLSNLKFSVSKYTSLFLSLAKNLSLLLISVSELKVEVIPLRYMLFDRLSQRP